MLRALAASLLLMPAAAFAQDPADPNTPDGMRAAPIEIVMSGMEGAPACAPDLFRMPVGNEVILMLRNEASRSLDFTAPDLFRTALMTDRDGGQAWMTGDGALLARVPPSGTVELRLTALEPGAFTYACLTPGMPEERFEGEITVVPTPSD